MKRYKAQEEIEEIEEVEIPSDDDIPPVEEAPEPDAPAIADIFPEEYVEPLRGLLFLGKLENEVFYGGHSFLIKTLTEGELLRIGQLCKPYVGTMVEIESRRMYLVAAAIEAVDGQPIIKQYKEGEDTTYEKAQEVRKWYPAVISYLYEEYIALEQTAIQVSNALKKS